MYLIEKPERSHEKLFEAVREGNKLAGYKITYRNQAVTYNNQ